MSPAQTPATDEHLAAEGPLGLPGPLGACEGPGEKGTGAQASAMGPGQRAAFHCDSEPEPAPVPRPHVQGANHQTEGQSAAF